jgi:hypothetical protein
LGQHNRPELVRNSKGQGSPAGPRKKKQNNLTMGDDGGIPYRLERHGAKFFREALLKSVSGEAIPMTAFGLSGPLEAPWAGLQD